jgi:hypothetical protein
MGWQELLQSLQSQTKQVLPWYGRRRIYNADRSWAIEGKLPLEHGWYLFSTPTGRAAELLDPQLQEADPCWIGSRPKQRGYLVGGRFIGDNSRVDPNPSLLIQQTSRVFCTESIMSRFARASVVKDFDGCLVYWGQEFPAGPDAEAVRAYEDRAPNLNHIQGVTPALDLAFRWVSYQREQVEIRRRELELLREKEERERAERNRIEELMKDSGSALGRRALALRDFPAAAKAALLISGAELLDVMPALKNEMIVRYRFRQRRFECVVEKETLRIVDAGICLRDERTGVKGDTWLTLESLPPTVGQAIDEDKLVVFRHI